MSLRFCIYALMIYALFGCSTSTRFDNPVSRVLLPKPVSSRLSVTGEFDQIATAVKHSFSKKSKSKQEISYRQSELLTYFNDVGSRFDIHDFNVSQIDTKFHGLYASKSTEEEKERILFRLPLPYNLLSPSYFADDSVLRVRGEFLIKLVQTDLKQVSINISAHDLVLVGDEVCGWHMHGFGCGNKTLAIDNEPALQYRLLMYLFDSLSAEGFAPNYIEP